MEKVKNDSKNVHKKRPLFFHIGLVISLLVTFAAFEFKVHIEDEGIVEFTEEEAPTFIADNIKRTKQPPKPKPAPINPKKNQSLIITDKPNPESIPEVEKEPIIDIEELNNLVSGDAPKSEAVEDPTVHIIVDSQAEFEGGLNAFYQYLREEINYPSRERKLGIEGKVYLEFVIERDGRLTDIKVVKPVSENLDQEALRVLKASPAWTPATIRGQAVRAKMTIPINFQLR